MIGPGVWRASPDTTLRVLEPRKEPATEQHLDPAWVSLLLLFLLFLLLLLLKRCALKKKKTEQVSLSLTLLNSFGRDSDYWSFSGNQDLQLRSSKSWWIAILKITDSYHFIGKIRKEIWKQGSLCALLHWIRSTLKRAKKLRLSFSSFPFLLCFRRYTTVKQKRRHDRFSSIMFSSFSYIRRFLFDSNPLKSPTNNRPRFSTARLKYTLSH